MQTPASTQPASVPPSPPASPASPALPTPPAPPAPPMLAPAAPGAQDAFLVPVQQLTVPRTAAEVSALRARGSELSRQLNSATGRREGIARELRRADGADQTGLELRLAQLDQRILGLEADIAANGRLLAAAPSNLLASTRESSPGDAGTVFLGGLGSGQVTAISIVFIIFVLAPMAAAYARRLWHRPVRTPQTAAALESEQRMERMEQAVDAIAIEVERVSESQRFLTRILTEAHDMPALGARAGAEPVPVRATAVGATTP